MDIDFVERLERRLGDELPGQAAQLRMAPIGREQYLAAPENANIACVLVLLFHKNKDWHVALIERTRLNPNDPHSGQISLPGGRMEITDDTHEDCALREVQEEIGINPEEVGILGGLSSLYVPVSNFNIFPFVGFTTNEPSFEPQPSEVQRVIEAPLDIFQGEKYVKSMNMIVRDIEMKNVPYFDVQKEILWGATAMIMSEFSEIMSEVY